jgi:hypothetical protein
MRREEIYAALDQMTTEDLAHFNAICPRCGKANKLSRKQLMRWAPKWEESAS